MGCRGALPVPLGNGRWKTRRSSQGVRGFDPRIFTHCSLCLRWCGINNKYVVRGMQFFLSFPGIELLLNYVIIYYKAQWCTGSLSPPGSKSTCTLHGETQTLLTMHFKHSVLPTCTPADTQFRVCLGITVGFRNWLAAKSNAFAIGLFRGRLTEQQQLHQGTTILRAVLFWKGLFKCLSVVRSGAAPVTRLGRLIIALCMEAL